MLRLCAQGVGKQQPTNGFSGEILEKVVKVPGECGIGSHIFDITIRIYVGGRQGEHDATESGDEDGYDDKVKP